MALVGFVSTLLAFDNGEKRRDNLKFVANSSVWFDIREEKGKERNRGKYGVFCQETFPFRLM